MKAVKWALVLLPVLLFFGCSSLERDIKLTINSEPPNAKIYEEGKLLGNAPLTLTYRYQISRDPLVEWYYILADQAPRVLDLLQPRTFTATKAGYETETKSVQFTSPHLEEFKNEEYKRCFYGTKPDFFLPLEFTLLFALDPQESKLQAQQQQQQQQVTIVMPGAAAAGAAKAFGALTILSTPAQAEVYVDGTFVATTPVSSLPIEAGPHKIEIQKPGYKTWSRAMQVLANTPVKIEIELEKSGGGF